MPQPLVVDRFYEAFARRDAAAMAACYHPDATFEDPAFGPLDREAAGAMWAMLLARATDLVITHQVLGEAGSEVRARWEARYTFTRTGRPVLNRIEATVILEDGLIRTHRDHFSFWAWARQAFGPAGLLLGWTPWFQTKVRAEALRGLAGFRAKTAGT
ncbi:MAG: nuclear transport factor 2 family protein [Geothrix sp.]|uniref:nuclear transport factor 2 family protein n=1 Tax=Geothrix sp. TaxID=1962974 RepID=UPI0017DA1853|nr:nuclear transport factor 2 family protein [Geothrix sp.]NWJ41222.1 nuclear transport factor 2 family protein [Geothrix sp.]WIL20787.1 MAG: nuclear transport factor 2 family protein [Geothrix sp.]